MIWLPLITAVFSLNSTFADDDGKAPAWLVALAGAIFQGMWTSYDGVFFRLFGDGERTIYKVGDEVNRNVRVGHLIEYTGIGEKGNSIYEDV